MAKHTTEYLLISLKLVGIFLYWCGDMSKCLLFLLFCCKTDRQKLNRHYEKRTARGLFYFPDPKNRPQAHTFGCDAFQFLAQPGRVSASDCVGAGTESRPYGFHKTES